MGLCHADWETTKYATCRIYMSLSHVVSITGFRRPDGPPFRDVFTGPQQATELVAIADLVRRFAAFVKSEYAPDMWQYPTKAVGHEDMDLDCGYAFGPTQRYLTGPCAQLIDAFNKMERRRTVEAEAKKG